MRGRFRVARRMVCAAALGVLALTGPGCAGDFDTTRSPAPRGSLGRELYTLVCDRIGAQALREDITGASYHDVCHADAAGNFAQSAVVTTLLPPLDPAARSADGTPVSLEQQEKNRANRVARIEALARRRDDLIGAFDAALTNEPIARRDPTTCEPGADVDLRAELGDVLGRMTDLYNDDTIPWLTRGLSQVMSDVTTSERAQGALARFDARRGYRPPAIAMGVAQPVLEYPRFVELAKALLPLVSADTKPTRLAKDRTPGKANAALIDLLGGMHQELRNAKLLPPQPPLVATPDPLDGTLLRLDRPRGNLEVARALLLDDAPAYSAGVTAKPTWIVRRDARGWAEVATNPSGALPAPFVDGAGGKPDGFADVDELGRFVTRGGDAPSPFADVFEKAPSKRDTDGKVPAFAYLDVSKTFAASLARDLVPLLDPDPAHQHETLMDFASGLALVAGVRDDGRTSERRYSDATLAYRGYRQDVSPLLDLVHASAQVFGARDSDDTLALLYRLAKEKPAVLARLIGVGLKIKAIADAHPEATIPAASTFWDEMLDVLTRIAQRPELVEDILRSLSDDATLDLPRSAIAYLTTRDELTYDRNALNGPVFNLTTGKVESLKSPVDRTKPATGSNRSAFQRFLQALHDTNGMSVCTKRGAVAHIVWNGVGMDFPSFGAQAACVVLGAQPPPDPMPMCGMLRFTNIAEEIVNAVLGKVNLDIRDDCLRELIRSPLTGIVGGADVFLEQVSGIEGFNTKPTVQGINRVVFFDLPGNGSPGDTKNPKTLNFLEDIFDPAPTLVCPELPFTDKDGVKLNLRQCAGPKDTLRSRDSNALFPLEVLGFLDSAKPLARAFQENEANVLFVDLFDVLHRHWADDAQSKDDCDPSAPKTDARWCSQDGAVRYEPLLAEALATDLFPALSDTVKELATIEIQHCDARDSAGVCTKSTPRDGVKVLAELVNDLVDPRRNVGLAQRRGETSVVRNDGTTNAQVTPIYLLVDALKGFDRQLAPDAARTSAWRRARSQIVDQFFTVEGTGKSSRLANGSVDTFLPLLLSTLRAQRAAHCPGPTKPCAWTATELTAKATETVTGPTFAGILGVLEGVAADEPARTELERLLVHLLAPGPNASPTLAAVADLLQVFEDDENLTPLLRAVSDAAAPEVIDANGRVESRGLVLAAIEATARVLGEVRDDSGARLCSQEIDPSHALVVALRKLVTPTAAGKPTPIEIILDVIADVNRVAPQETTKLAPGDYGNIAREVSEFCTHPSRGLEQAYAVIKEATKDL
jgi:hypothetical protein